MESTIFSLTLPTLLACTPESPEATPGGDDAVDEVSEASLTADEVGERLSAALAEPIPDWGTLKASYAAILKAGLDGHCPATADPMNPSAAWSDYCQAETGYGFYGKGIINAVEEPDSSWERFIAGMEIIDPDGDVFIAGGEVMVEHLDAGGWELQLSGTYHYPKADGWLGEGRDLGIWAADDGEVFSLFGSLSTPLADVSLSQLQLSPSDCGEHPVGQIELRGDDGYWYTLTFDESTCDGCGQVTFGDADLGTSCLDLRPLLSAARDGLIGQ